jgi:hypothetical protein
MLLELPKFDKDIEVLVDKWNIFHKKRCKS